MANGRRNRAAWIRWLAVTLLLLPAASLAQKSPSTPVQLLPPAPQTAPAAAPLEPKKIVNGQPRKKSAKRQTIQVESLLGYSATSIGPLSQGRGGFGNDLWLNVPMQRVQHLLGALPHQMPLPGLQDIYWRLLLTASVAPDGAGAGTEFLLLRMQRLDQGGHLPGMAALLRLLPDSISDPRITRWKLIKALLSDNLDDACGLARRMLSADDAVIWLKVSILCDADAGEAAKVELSQQLVAEMGDEDAPFDALLDRLLAHQESAPINLSTLSPLHFATAQAAGIALDWPVIQASPPLLQRAAVQAAFLPTPVATTAARAAFNQGTLSADQLRQQYGRIVFEADELEADRPENKRPESAYDQARSLQITFRAADGMAQMQQTAMALERARTYRNFYRISALYLPLLKKWDAATACSKVTPRVAMKFAKALLLHSAAAPAETWLLRCIDPQAVENAEGEDTAARLWPWLRVTQPADERPSDAGWLARWWKNNFKKTKGAAGRDALWKGAVLLHVLDGLGIATAPDYWTELMLADTGSAKIARSSLETAVWRTALEHAVEANRKGEALLIVLNLLSINDSKQLNPADIRAGLGALRTLGLSGEANRLALDILGANQF